MRALGEDSHPSDRLDTARRRWAAHGSNLEVGQRWASRFRCQMQFVWSRLDLVPYVSQGGQSSSHR